MSKTEAVDELLSNIGGIVRILHRGKGLKGWGLNRRGLGYHRKELEDQSFHVIPSHHGRGLQGWGFHGRGLAGLSHCEKEQQCGVTPS